MTTRRALRREADALGIVWCRWCGGELDQSRGAAGGVSQHPDDWGRHLDGAGVDADSPCEDDGMTNTEGTG